MSYDLNLHPRSGTALTAESFRAHFTDAERFTLHGDVARYSNDDTGVYFQLTYYVPIASDEKGKSGDAAGPHVWMNVNFCRPRFFGREASSVLAGVADDLELMIHDEDGGTIDDGDAIAEEMLRQWNEGNDWACRAILAMSGATGIHSLPGDFLHNCWVWTYHREERNSDLFDDGHDVFVPKVMFVERGGELKTLVVYPNVIPTAVPKVDLVLVTRDEMPAGKKGRRTKPALVTWDELRAALPGFEVDEEGPLPFLLLNYGTAEEAPPEVVKFVHGLEAFTDKIQGVSADHVLDADLLPGAVA